MDENAPLDLGMRDTQEDARPAGEWLEGYWRQTIPWAFRTAWMCWIFAGFSALISLMGYRSMMGSEGGLTTLGLMVGALLVYSPVFALGYWLQRFGRQLQAALMMTDQVALENAFVQLYRTMLAAGLVAFFWVLLMINNTYITLDFYSNF